MERKIIIGIVVIFLLIQFIRIDKENPPVQKEMDFITITNPPIEIGTILRTSCYDCHSNESSYPWYTNISPVSWWIKDHINDGREELNFSEWGKYKVKKMDHKLEECIELVQEGEMPMSSYTLMHSSATLSKEQQHQLVEWFERLRK